ncbi:MAG: nucleotidyltransferase domain-containing protein [Cyanobacteria bacterium P01_A01_bin.84]
MSVRTNRYLRNILKHEAVDTSSTSPLIRVQKKVKPIIRRWAGNFLANIYPSGSFAKGTANKSGTDIDIFVSLSSNTQENLRHIYNSLYSELKRNGYLPRKQNVSLGIKVNGYKVDIIPAKRQSAYGNNHSLYRRKANTWTKTNIQTHITKVSNSSRIDEIRLIKLWRDHFNIDFPSFYIELVAIKVLRGSPHNNLGNNVLKVFRYLTNKFLSDRYVDPANTNNIISDDLTASDKRTVAREAQHALLAETWSDIIK